MSAPPSKVDFFLRVWIDAARFIEIPAVKGKVDTLFGSAAAAVICYCGVHHEFSFASLSKTSELALGVIF
jgi:hypothetical protein